jgi:hypothetical protein
MAVLAPHFLRSILTCHEHLQQQIPYPFFDPACVRYEALRLRAVEGASREEAMERFGLSDYELRQSAAAFARCGVAGLIGLASRALTEPLDLEVERMAFVLKQARPALPATQMVLILEGFQHPVPLDTMRRLYASYGWAAGTKPYEAFDFASLNLKVQTLCRLRERRRTSPAFVDPNDPVQELLEVFRTLGERGVTRRYPRSKFSFAQRKADFLCFGLVGLVDRARPPFRNSKLGFAEEGRLILSKIQHPQNTERHYLRVLASKKIVVDATCLTKIFSRWNVAAFRSVFPGDLPRLLAPEEKQGPGAEEGPSPGQGRREARPLRLDKSFVAFVHHLEGQAVTLANPGVFLFLPYLHRLGVCQTAAALFDVDPDRGYSWFSLLLLNVGRIFAGISSVSKACRVSDLSLALSAGLVAMPANDSILNGLATIEEPALLALRRALTRAARALGLVQGKRIALDFQMRDFTGDDVALKNIGKGPSPKRKICFPGFRPHLAWDVETGAPISLEFRNGKARASTTVKRFIRELLLRSLGDQDVEHVYLDSEYTAAHVWQFIVDPEEGLGADLTMCIKQNKKVKKHIDAFLRTSPTWVYYDEDHTYSEQQFDIPIQDTNKSLHCVLKRQESNGRLRCFGSTLNGLDSKAILDEYKSRWTIENGIKDLVESYYFDHIPGIDPHRINIHYFVVTLARLAYELFSLDYDEAFNPDGTKRTLGAIRPEFIAGSTGVLSRAGEQLIVKWDDPFEAKQHQALTNLFHKLNYERQARLPFLGGLRIRYELGPPRPKTLTNRLRRGLVEF